MSKLYLKPRRMRSPQLPAAVSLPFPLHSHIRLAQLGELGASFGVKPFRPASIIDLQGFQPNMIAGSALELQRLAEQVELGTVDLASVDHAIIALTRCSQEPISDVDRVVLWQTFGVPVFEVFTAPDQSILAFECELHEGWHLAADVICSETNGEILLTSPANGLLHTSLTGLVVAGPCPCGRPGVRLLQLEPVKRADLLWAVSA